MLKMEVLSKVKDIMTRTRLAKGVISRRIVVSVGARVINGKKKKN